MKKIRSLIATIALVATLSGLSLQGWGLASIAHAASSQHHSSPFVAGQLTKSVAFRRDPPCPGGGVLDC